MAAATGVSVVLPGVKESKKKETQSAEDRQYMLDKAQAKRDRKAKRRAK